MNEQIRNILVQETTKTSKIRQLYLLGVPRAEIARMVTNGNYGFVVNALRRMREREGGPNVQPLAAAPDYTFNRKFGIEIEATTVPANGSHASSGRPISRLRWKVTTIPPVRIGNS